MISKKWTINNSNNNNSNSNNYNSSNNNKINMVLVSKMNYFKNNQHFWLVQSLQNITTCSKSAK